MDTAPVTLQDIISRVLICVGLYTGAALVFGVLLAVVMIKYDDIKRKLRPRPRHLKLVDTERDNEKE